ncbi:methyltransferase-like protein 7B [Anneissia japonica]|uniref:methyltransferase-like protein 7B n=1 Tax=Anneissia japonica TaxID=1529436 RepID=UPI0014259116|nr:methyltransferase-like protein 7B [Anneissia japonica]
MILYFYITLTTESEDMAESDLTIRTFIIYAIGTLIALKVISVLWSFCHRRVFACYMTRLISPGLEELLAEFKREIFEDLPDVEKRLKTDGLTILEIGVGSGVNFKFYPKGSTVYPLDPNPHFNQYLEENIEKNKHVNVKPFVECYGEDMTAQVADKSIDVVVSTMTLCSVLDIAAVLREVRRVLKSGGKFYFIEHVADTKGTWLSVFQAIATQVYKRIADNCHWNRKTWLYIDRAGFTSVQHRKQRKAIHILLYGSATK